MEKEEKKFRDATSLLRYMRNLPYCKMSSTAKEMAEKCGVPLYIFNNWRYGLSKIPESAKSKLEEIAGEPIFNKEAEL